MVILILVTMLILSAAISIDAVWPVVAAVGLFVPLYLIYLTGCVLPGYAKIRVASSAKRPASRPHAPARPVVLGPKLPVAR
jgi:hypothetical protein